MKWFPWVGMLFFAAVAAVGWYKALFSVQDSQLVARQAFQREERTVEQSALRATKDAAKKKGKSPRLEPKSNHFSPLSKDAKAMDKQIQRKAERLAERLTHEKIQEYKQAEKIKEKDGVLQYFDGMETLFTRSVDSYAEAFDVEIDTIQALHQIVFDGFAKQREITDRYYAGELTEQEAKRQGAQAHEEDKVLVVSLLGEEGAEDFGLIVREEGAKMKAEKAEASP